jgi:CheY-like chemotaxis protein
MASASDRAPEPPPGAGALRVLVADDDRGLRDLVAEALRADGHAVAEASSGEGLLERLSALIVDQREPPFDLVISDLRMPLLLGTEVLAGIRALGSRLEFVLMTAFGDERVHREAVALGALAALAVLDKPFELARLRDLVGALARGRAARPVGV